jgi:enamine deaminase RidA (YjgF/YER057c/UK114 family)
LGPIDGTHGENRRLTYPTLEISLTVTDQLVRLGLELPIPPTPKGSYVPYRKIGDLLFLAGVVGSRNGDQLYRGKVGAAVSLTEARAAARQCALNHLSIMNQALGGLDRIECLVRVTGYVNVAPGFTQLTAVLDGASDLFVEVLGEGGTHVRAVVGVAEIANDQPVETDLIAQLRS